MMSRKMVRKMSRKARWRYTSSMTFADEEEEKLGRTIDVDRANVGKFSKVHFPTTGRTLHMFLCRLEAHSHFCGRISSPFLCYHRQAVESSL